MEIIEHVQAEVAPAEWLAFLRDPASYPHRPEDVEVIQTHISYVALASPYVYKVKKPVNFGFLDFSTLERRRYYCGEEVRLNRRLCPATYEGVVPVLRRHGTLAFAEDDRDDDGAEDEVVDYAVKMKQLADGFFLHQWLAQGALTPAHLDRVVAALAAFYRAEKPTPGGAAWGRTEKLKISTDENFAQTEPFVGDLISRSAFEAVRYFTNRFYDYHARLLNRRRAEGHVLDCHGDLRLEHVHLTPEAVCIYDGIEFSERLRYIDVANDVAFLAMDLDFNGQPGLAAYFTRSMVRVLDDPDLPVLLDFYKSYRAYVRAKVEHMRSREVEVPEAERQASRARAKRYYRLALRYAVAGSKPLVVVVMGNIGSGKSTIARLLGDALGWEVFSSDRTRKELAGVPVYERGDQAAREALYTRRLTLATYDALRDRALERYGKHQGTVLDASYSRRNLRDTLRAALRQDSIPYRFVELKASEATVKARLRARENAHGLVTDARLEDFETLRTRYQAPDDLEEARHFTVSSDGSPEEAAREALEHLIRFTV